MQILFRIFSFTNLRLHLTAPKHADIGPDLARRRQESGYVREYGHDIPSVIKVIECPKIAFSSDCLFVS